MGAGAHLYMTERSMAKTGCTVELLEVPRNMADTKMAPITFSTSPCDVLKAITHRTHDCICNKATWSSASPSKIISLPATCSGYSSGYLQPRSITRLQVDITNPSTKLSLRHNLAAGSSTTVGATIARSISEWEGQEGVHTCGCPGPSRWRPR